MAVSVSASGRARWYAGARTSTLSLNILIEDLDEGLELFFDVLMNPEFRRGPVNLAKVSRIQGLRQANDQPNSVLSREYDRLLYGDHPLTWDPTQATYESISPSDLKAVHSQYFFPANIILAAAGDFEPSNEGGKQWPGPLDKLGKVHTITLKDPLTGK